MNGAALAEPTSPSDSSVTMSRRFIAPKYAYNERGRGVVMSRQKTTVSAPIRALRRAALRHPDVHEGISCEGTSLEKRTVKTHNKAFVFLGMADVMVKLKASLFEATRLAKTEPDRYKAGAHGW